MDLVSILVPCYNHERFVADCLRSLCEQTYQNIELILTDDCSKDNSFEIIKTFEEELKNFQPSLEVEEAEAAINNRNLADVTDIITELIHDIKTGNSY